MHTPFTDEVIEANEQVQIIRNGDSMPAEVPRSRQSTIPHFLKSSINAPED